MLDVRFPTTDGRTLILSRYTELTADQKTSGLPPQTRSSATAAATYYCARKDRSPPGQRRVVETFAMPLLISLTFFAELGKLG
jgi:hypothetical protein